MSAYRTFGIIVRTGNKKLNQKRYEVNPFLKELCKKRNIYLIDNTNKIKAQRLNEGKLRLNKRNSNIPGSRPTFFSE